MSVLVVLEGRTGEWNRLSFEALSAAVEVAELTGTAASAVVVGYGMAASASEAATRSVEKVWVLDDKLLGNYTPDAFTAALEQLIAHVKPNTVVFPHTYEVRDYVPKLGARLGVPLLSDVVGFTDGAFVRQYFQGKLNAEVPFSEGLQLVSVQAGSFRAAEPASAAAPVENFTLHLDPSAIRSKPEPPFREAQRSVDLGAADLIVSVGRGIKEKENLRVAEELAAALGAELAASRPICDNGWLPMERQVGSSGQTVAPKLYVALGISGAIQHLVGMKGARTVVAINKDETAPIFETADYGILADLFDVVPAITEEVKKAKS